MKPIFDPEELTLMTEPENKLFNQYIEECQKYLDGEADGVKMKQASVQIGNLTKIVQSRSATALLKFNMLRIDDDPLTIRMTKKEIESPNGNHENRHH